MKVKTSITLSEDILQDLEQISESYSNRSELIEEALRFFIKRRLRKMREAKDLELLNKRASVLNKEAEDVLSYQVEL